MTSPDPERTLGPARGLSSERTWPGRVVRGVVTAALLALVLRLVDFAELFRVVATARPGYLALALLVAGADRLLMIGKWYPLLRIQVGDAPFALAARSYFATGFASNFLPSSLGGDVLRAIAVGRRSGAVVEAGVSIVAERLFGMAGLGALAVLSLALAARADVPLGFLLPWAVGMIALPIVGHAGTIAATRSSGLRAWISARTRARWARGLLRFVDAWAVYRRHRATIAVVLVLSFVEQLFPTLVFWMLSLSFHASAGLATLIVAVPLTTFAARLPISIGGLGVAEVSLVYLTGLFGVPATEAIALALAGRIVALVAVLPGALFWRDLLATRG